MNDRELKIEFMEIKGMLCGILGLLGLMNDYIFAGSVMLLLGVVVMILVCVNDFISKKEELK